VDDGIAGRDDKYAVAARRRRELLDGLVHLDARHLLHRARPDADEHLPGAEIEEIAHLRAEGAVDSRQHDRIHHLELRRPQAPDD
jgi:hypothetical protein